MLRFYSKKVSVSADKEWVCGRKSECIESVNLINWMAEREMVIEKKFELRL